MNERDRKYFKQVLRKIDDNQVQWVLEHDYPEWKKELAKEEQIRRKNK
jgi:NADPH:quinone reductase-like Zn-dependent oxidoreductase